MLLQLVLKGYCLLILKKALVPPDEIKTTDRSVERLVAFD